MTPHFLIQSLASIPLFSSRGFLTLFVVACVARFGLGSIVAPLENVPEWFVADIALWLFGALAAAELLAEKVPELRDWLSEFDPEIKGLIGLLASGALISGGAHTTEVPVLQASVSLASLWALAVGGAVWALARVRRNLLGFLGEIDPDDQLKIRALLAWLEDLGALAGLVLMLVMAKVALVVAGLTVLGMVVLQWRLRARDEKSKRPCLRCGKPGYPTALVCSGCSHPLPSPVEVGWFGGPRRHPVMDVALHEIRLISHKRCPRCANRLPDRAIRQECPACGTVTFRDAAAAEAYLRATDRHLPKVLAVCALCSAFPVFGLIPGIVYYRCTLIAGIGGYIPLTARFRARWLMRLWNLLLVALQWLPFVGAAMLPLMAFTNYRYYRRILAREARLKLPAADAYPAPLSGPPLPAYRS